MLPMQHMRAPALQSRRMSHCKNRAVSVPARTSVVASAMKALIFDCDGVIVETEELHRKAYNASFQEHNVQIGGKIVDWSVPYYDVLQNKVGGGKPKMRYHFGNEGWPTSDVLPSVPTTEEEKDKLLDVLQVWKTKKYTDLVGNDAEPREGVLRVMDEAREAGLKLAVCSAGTKAAVTFTVNSLIGKARFEALDLFMAGDDVDKKKPDPTIYRVAAERLGVQPDECVVIEDSYIGLQAARGAGMRCIITYTDSTKSQEYPGAERIVYSLGGYPPNVTVKELQEKRIVQDDRIEMSVSPDGSSVVFHIPEGQM